MLTRENIKNLSLCDLDFDYSDWRIQVVPTNLPTKHRALFLKKKTKNGIPYLEYFKQETDDAFLHFKTWSISINEDVFKTVDLVTVQLRHRGVVLVASKPKIEACSKFKTFHGEVKRYMPCEAWTIYRGPSNWNSIMRSQIRSLEDVRK